MQDDICRIKEEHRLNLFKGIRRLFEYKRKEVIAKQNRIT